MSTARSVVLKGLADGVVRVGTLVSLPLVARYVGADGYGAYIQLTTLVALVVPVASLGLASSMVRFFSAGPWTKTMRTRLMRAELLAVIIAAAFGLAMVASAPMLNVLLLQWEGGSDLFRWGALLVIAGSGQQLLLDFLRSRQWLVQLSLLQIAESAVTVGAMFLLLSTGRGLVELVQAIFLAKLCVMAAILLGLGSWNRPHLSLSPQPEASFGQMLRFGLPLLLGTAGLWMMNVGDRLVIGHFMDSSALGLYAAVYTLAFALVAVNAPLNFPLYPRMMRAIGAGNIPGLAQEVRLFHRYATLVLVPMAALLIAIMNPLLTLMAGDAFRVDILLVALLVAAVFTDQWNSPAHYILLCHDQVAFTRNAWLTAGASNIAANLVAVPLFGLNGAAFVSLSTFLLLETSILCKANHFVPIGPLYRFDVLVRAALSSAPAAAVLLLISLAASSNISTVLIGSACFGLAYLGLMMTLRGIGKEDFLMLVRAATFRRLQEQE